MKPIQSKETQTIKAIRNRAWLALRAMIERGKAIGHPPLELNDTLRAVWDATFMKIQKGELPDETQFKELKGLDALRESVPDEEFNAALNSFYLELARGECLLIDLNKRKTAAPIN